MRQFPGNSAKNLMFINLLFKFLYSQAHESLCKKWFIHLQGRSHKELDRQLNFLKESSKIMCNCRKIKDVAEKIRSVGESNKVRKQETTQNIKPLRYSE